VSVFAAIMSRIFSASGGMAAHEEVAEHAGRTVGASPPAVSPPETPPGPAQPTPQPAAQPIDVEAVLDDLAREKGADGTWRHSAAGLLRLLDLDSGAAARAELARELGVQGADEAALHRAVMLKLAEHGAHVPEQAG